MKVYTKTGDRGETSLLGGNRVPKFHERIEAYGTLDELNSWIGMLREAPNDEETDQLLEQVQNYLFHMGSHLAAENELGKSYLSPLNAEAHLALEKEIDRMDSSLEPLKNFILPGGSQQVAQIHVARCVCRRAERFLVYLSQQHTIEPSMIIFLNRLSDFLFVLGRYIAKKQGVSEVLWDSKKLF